MDRKVETDAGATDLVLTRIVDVPRHLIWLAWTRKEHLEAWWCPKPYSVTVTAMDLRPGGAFSTRMRSPEGKDLPEERGCYLELVENERLVFTSALTEGFRPAPEVRTQGEDCSEIMMTVILTLEPVGEGATRYTARVLHRDVADTQKHEKMGFHEGWNIALDQLVDYAKTQLQAR